MSDQVDAMAYALSSAAHLRGVDAETGVELHAAEAHRVIAAELVACTLGQRSRLELRVDPLGRFAFLVRKWTRALSGLLGAR